MEVKKYRKLIKRCLLARWLLNFLRLLTLCLYHLMLVLWGFLDLFDNKAPESMAIQIVMIQAPMQQHEARVYVPGPMIIIRSGMCALLKMFCMILRFVHVMAWTD